MTLHDAVDAPFYDFVVIYYIGSTLETFYGPIRVVG